MHYLLATVLSVEAAILHNFFWHWRWTWRDRRGAVGHAIPALARFNLTNGLVSITANLLSAFLLTGAWQIDPIIASLVSTTVGSVANFFLSDRLVFANSLSRGSPCGWAKSTAKAAPVSDTSPPAGQLHSRPLVSDVHDSGNEALRDCCGQLVARRDAPSPGPPRLRKTPTRATLSPKRGEGRRSMIHCVASE